MKLKVLNGTRSDSTSLCDSCNRSMIIKGATESHVIKHCHHMDKRVPYNVAECSGYYPRNLPSMRDLQETAWILSTSKGRTIGFNPPKKKNEYSPDEPLDTPFDK